MLKLLANNKRASFEYFILDTLECGIVLEGSEIKSLRNSACSIQDSYIQIKNNELIMLNMNIPEYNYANIQNHEPTRIRKLLAHKKEILKLSNKVKKEGMTIVPLQVYFDSNNKVKVKIGLCKGKHTFDKRESIKQKEINRKEIRRYKDS